MVKTSYDNTKGALGRLFWLLAGVTLLATSCQSESDIQRIEGQAQGTTFHVTLYDAPVGDWAARIGAWLQAYNREASAWDPESTLSRYNAGDYDEPTPIFEHLLAETREIYALAYPALEPYMGHIIEAWGFGVGDGYLTLSDSAMVDSLMDLTFTDPMLNVNAYSQGHSVDILVDSLLAHGVTTAFVEVGGELRVMGSKPDGSAWMVGIEQPTEEKGQSLMAQVPIQLGYALATSGNYRNYQIDSASGRKYGHTLNAHTGWPARTDLLSATMIGPKCVYADGMATAAMSMGLAATQTWLTEHPDWDAYLIYSDSTGGYQVWTTLELE